MRRHAWVSVAVLLGMLACRSGSRSAPAAQPATMVGTWGVAPNQSLAFPTTAGRLGPVASVKVTPASRFVISETKVLAVGDGPRNVKDEGLLLMDLYGNYGTLKWLKNEYESWPNPEAATLQWRWSAPFGGDDEDWAFLFEFDPQVPAVARLEFYFVRSRATGGGHEGDHQTATINLVRI